ncbi:hypothetical protein B0A52_08217 [Exophiala mesophila]|uniref:Mso1 N-terminal domain-containing protein n=1 Tax=Exophiala mesophila TaxID=212818 RepID=A0A438MWE3_EXOME|nr:hypothetical protein B0A52_08217 [Exophiala mesophila]
MASYLSYFTSQSNPQPPSQSGTPQPATTTWSSSLSSRLAGLRKALTKDSEEDDPDNEDCSHVSNVLRAYYTEKGQAFPEWLPPDPKKPVAPPPVQASYGQYGNAYGAGYPNSTTHARGGSGGRSGGLSDLWDSAPSQNAPPPQAPQSLRAARPTPQSLRSSEMSRSGSSGGAPSNMYNTGPTSNARPLPSQRAGSYQTSNPAAATQSGGLGSRDRLRARLQGGGDSGRNSPSAGLNSGGQPSYGPPGGSGGGLDRTRSSQPYISASEPWSTGGDPYAQGGSYNDGGLSNMQYSNRQRPGGPR